MDKHTSLSEQILLGQTEGNRELDELVDQMLHKAFEPVATAFPTILTGYFSPHDHATLHAALTQALITWVHSNTALD